jgi:hypothetical protein
VKDPTAIARATQLAALLLAVQTALADEPSPAPSPSILEIEADRVTLTADRETILAEGNVRLEVDTLVLESGSMIVDTASGRVVLGAPLRLDLPMAHVGGRLLVLDPSAGLLRIEDPQLLVPAADRYELLLNAERATCTAAGCDGDVDLTRPELYVGDTRVAALPWLRVRPPDAAGFLPPRLAWDARGGLILGPAGQLPISDDLVLSGHAAVRTSQGFETRSEARTRDGELTVDQLFDAPQNHLRARFHLAPPLGGATLTMDGDLVDGRQIIDDLTFDPLERARTHTASRALLSSHLGDAIVTESRLEILQAFDPRGALERSLHTPAVGVSAQLLPETRIGPIWPGLTAELTRRDALTSAPAPDAAGGLAPPHTALTASPSLTHDRRLGPLAAELTAATLHRIWLPDRSAVTSYSRHLAAFSAQLELPLVGRPGGARHVINPLVRYRATPWIDGQSPTWVLTDLDRLRRAHGLEAGLDNLLGSTGAHDLLRLRLLERFDLPGLDGEPGAAYLFLAAGVGPRWLRLTAEGSWDHREHLPSGARVALATADGRGNALTTGASWYGPGRGAHLDRVWSSGQEPWTVGPWAGALARSLELEEQATVAFTRRFRASAGARVGIVPDPRLHALWYGLEFGSACGCLVAGILASHRLDSWVPDMMATIGLRDL